MTTQQSDRTTYSIAGFGIDWREYDWGSERYLRTGSMMPEDGLAQLARSDAILLGAGGMPEVELDILERLAAGSAKRG